MASAGLLALIDDIALLLDDVALLSKVAAKKTAAVLGDDLALNAQQVSGVRAERELPVVWAVAKGSAKNKLILVPAALLLSVFVPWLITPLLMIGGGFLCYEGFEKVFHSIAHRKGKSDDEARAIRDALLDPDFDLVAFEKEKIKGAIRTDFILSAEIVVIALGTVQHVDFVQQFAVITVIAAGITVGVYGLVAGIVKLDDAGLYLMNLKQQGITWNIIRGFGRGLLNLCPYLMKALSVLGTAAMFLVGGGIVVHGIPGAHDIVHHFVQSIMGSSPWLAIVPEFVLGSFANAMIGVLIGAILVFGLMPLISLFKRLKQH